MIRDVFAAAAAITTRRRRRSGIEHFDRSVGRARRHSLYVSLLLFSLMMMMIGSNVVLREYKKCQQLFLERESFVGVDLSLSQHTIQRTLPRASSCV